MIMMKVTDILKGAKVSTDFETFNGSAAEWMKMIDSKATDGGFFNLVDAIVDNGWQENSVVGLYKGYEIDEGHHRIAAAILLGLDEIPVDLTGGGKSSGNVNAHTSDGTYRDHNGEVFYTDEDILSA